MNEAGSSRETGSAPPTSRGDDKMNSPSAGAWSPYRPFGPASRIALAIAVMSGLLVCLPLTAQDPGIHVGAVVGQVYDQDTREWIGGVEITIDDGEPVITDAEGRFRIDAIPVGWHRVVSRRIGYETRVDTIGIPTNSVLAVQVALSRTPVVLTPLVISVRSATLERNGFYERARQGYSGVYLDRARIEDKRVTTVTQLFRGVTGIRVVYDGLYGARLIVNQVVSLRDPNQDRGGCEPSYWIDGVRSTMTSPDVMRLEELEGVEVYRRAGAPGKFIDPCGTILFWTRVPAKSRL